MVKNKSKTNAQNQQVANAQPEPPPVSVPNTRSRSTNPPLPATVGSAGSNPSVTSQPSVATGSIPASNTIPVNIPPHGGSSLASGNSGSTQSSQYYSKIRIILESIERFERRLCDWNPSSIAELTVKETRFEELRSNFNSWQIQLHGIVTSMDDASPLLDSLSSSIDHCETQLEDCHLKILERRFHLDTQISGAASAAGSVHADSANAKSAFKLERLKPPTFSGDFTQWETFRDLFLSAIHNNTSLSSAEKMVYLKTCLHGEALTIIQSFSSTASSYADAWHLINKRYSNLREILFSHLRKFDELPRADDTASGIRKITDSLNELSRSLKSQNVPVEAWDVILVYWTLQKLHAETRRQWLLDQEGTESPILTELVDFLEHRARALSDGQARKGYDPKSASTSAGQRKPGKKQDGKSKSAFTITAPAPNPKFQAKFACFLCHEKHFLFQCPKFSSLTVPQRIDAVHAQHLCKNCFNKHPTRDCQKSTKCLSCAKNHHTLLHLETNQPSGSFSRETNQQQHPAQSAPAIDSQPQLSQHGSGSSRFILLDTALAYVKNTGGEMKIARVFLDKGSQVDFITQSCANNLGLSPTGRPTKISGAAGTHCGFTKGQVKLTLYSTHSNFKLAVTLDVIENITDGDLPRCKGESEFPHISGLPLADPMFYKPQPVDILLGADYVNAIWKFGFIFGPKGTPAAAETQFGWVLSGKSPLAQDHKNHHNCLYSSTYEPSCFTNISGVPTPSNAIDMKDVSLRDSLTKFWETEEPGKADLLRSEEDKHCEEFFQRTTTRQPDGRYIVKLPFKQNHEPLKESLHTAVIRFRSVERRCQLDPVLKEAYTRYFQDHLAKGILEKIPPDQIALGPTSSYYMPYSHVVKESSSTTKLRIVYDCSASTAHGPSLNSILSTGSKLIADLVSLLVRFRTYPVAFSGDIEKFFNQVGVADEDKNFQRLVYRENPSLPLEHYRMNRLTFGLTPAPFLASRALMQLFDDEQASPKAKQVIHEETLVDNVLTGAFTLDEAAVLQDELISIMAKGKMHLRKWASNCQELIDHFPKELCEVSNELTIADELGLPTLGLKWNPLKDSFSVVIPPPKMDVQPNKRSVLSTIARIYDPLGWTSPVTVRAKILIQRLWKDKLDWDEPLSANHLSTWKSIAKDLELLKEFSIPRCYFVPSLPPAVSTNRPKIVVRDSIKYEVFGFSDASSLAVSAVVYLRATDNFGVSTVSLVGSKTKVAPPKGETTPRLELNGARLLAKFLRTILDSLTIPVAATTCFSDSTSVLGQLHPKFKDAKDIFFRNRIRTIQQLLPTTPWIHVDGSENPADCCSRGITTKEFLNHGLYFQGPPWLAAYVSPSQVSYSGRQCHVVKASTTNVILQFMQRCPSYFRMCRVIAQCIRAKEIFLKKHNHEKGSSLGVSDMKSALTLLARTVQQEAFPDESKALKKSEPISSSSSLKFLSPFLDADGLIRVGGRLKRATISTEAKHPILLPKKHHFTNVLVRYYHITNLHAGPTLLQALITEKFWIVGAPLVTKRIVRACITCFKNKPRPLSQLMSDLPAARVTLTRPFANTAMDFCGHFILCVTPGRGPKLTKSYVCVYVCMATKAVHLELVGDLTTASFLASLKRFVSRRGRPQALYSDSGKNFIGAKAELDRVVAFLNSTEFQERINLFGSEEGIRFYFNSPLSPHHGGLFEAAVKSAKYHLHRMMKDRHLSHEEFNTLLTQVEAVLNSRPITPMSSDPNDYNVLTPAHFLIGSPLRAIPEENLTTVNENRLNRWQKSQKLYQDFYRRFHAEYLKTLQSRVKWINGSPNIIIGTMVLAKETDDAFSNKWNLARVTNTFPGKDGRVRVVEIRNAAGRVFRRPIVKIAPLPIEDSN